MPLHRLTRVLPYTPDQLFTLVGDVDRYPEFVPWISSLRTWNRRAEADGAETLDAEATVGFSLLTERFTTRVRLDPAARAIRVDLIRGPFRRLVNEWGFTDHPDGAEISFLIDYEFRSRILGAILDANFDRAVNKLIACFDARASQLYPTAPPAP